MSVYSEFREEFPNVINSLSEERQSYCFYCGASGNIIDKDGVHCSNNECLSWKSNERYCVQCGDGAWGSGGWCQFCSDARKYGTSKEFEIYMARRIGVYLEEVANQKLEYLRFYKAIRDDQS